jgi:hypothetical protein
VGLAISKNPPHEPHTSTFIAYTCSGHTVSVDAGSFADDLVFQRHPFQFAAT